MKSKINILATLCALLFSCVAGLGQNVQAPNSSANLIPLRRLDPSGATDGNIPTWNAANQNEDGSLGRWVTGTGTPFTRTLLSAPDATSAQNILGITSGTNSGTYVTLYATTNFITNEFVTVQVVTNQYVSVSYVTNQTVVTNNVSYSYTTNEYVTTSYITNLNYTIAKGGTLTITNVTISSGGGLTNLNLSANALVVTDPNKQEISLANGAGVLTNSASGPPSYSATLPASLMGSMVRTIDIPMGAWFTNNCGNGADVSTASMLTLTNSGDTPVFTVSATSTNEIRTRYSLPRDWDINSVQLHTFWACTGTNSASASKTNFVVKYDAAAVGAGDRLDSLSFGTAVYWTNNCNPFPYEQGTEGITSGLTVGNTPAAGKGIVWRIQVLGNASGTSETNSSLYLAHFTVEYRRTPSNTFATPQ